MQEFLEWLENSSDVQNDILNWQIVKENALEKEKEQIIRDYKEGYYNGQLIFTADEPMPADIYYNETYNQNK